MKMEQWHEELGRLQGDVARAAETHKRAVEHLGKFIFETTGVKLEGQIGIEQIVSLASKVFDMREAK